MLRILRDVALPIPELEIRGAAVALRGARDYSWLDELMGHVTAPHKYRQASAVGRDPVLRLTGGEWRPAGTTDE